MNFHVDIYLVSRPSKDTVPLETCMFGWSRRSIVCSSRRADYDVLTSFTSILSKFSSQPSDSTHPDLPSTPPSQPKPRRFLIVGLGNKGPEYVGTRHNIGKDLIGKMASTINFPLINQKYSARYTDPVSLSCWPISEDLRKYSDNLLHQQRKQIQKERAKNSNDKATNTSEDVKENALSSSTTEKALLSSPPPTIILATLECYMNESGSPLRTLMDGLGIRMPSQVLLLHDELDLSPGVVRLSVSGNANGQKGVLSVQRVVKDGNKVPRVRLGIGRPSSTNDVPEFVLAKFTRDELLCMNGRGKKSGEQDDSGEWPQDRSLSERVMDMVYCYAIHGLPTAQAWTNGKAIGNKSNSQRDETAKKEREKRKAQYEAINIAQQQAILARRAATAIEEARLTDSMKSEGNNSTNNAWTFSGCYAQKKGEENGDALKRNAEDNTAKKCPHQDLKTTEQTT